MESAFRSPSLRESLDPFRSARYFEEREKIESAQDQQRAADSVFQNESDLIETGNADAIRKRIDEKTAELSRERLRQPRPLPGFAAAAAMQIPEAIRPSSLPRALGLGAVEDLVTGEEVRLDDTGTLLELGGGIAGAALPYRLAAAPAYAGFKGLSSQGVRSALGSAAGSGTAGLLSQPLDNAQALLDEAQRLDFEMSRSQALRGSLLDTGAEQYALRFLSNALLDLGMAGAANAPNLGRAAFGRWAGLEGPQVDSLVAAAQSGNVKIPLAIQDAAQNRAIAKGQSVIGKLPSTTGIFLDRAETVAKGLRDKIVDATRGVAPTIQTLQEFTGESLTRRILERNVAAFNRVNSAFRSFKGGADQRYGAFLQAAEESGATVIISSGKLAAVLERKKLRDAIPKERQVDTGLLDQAGNPIYRKEKVAPKVKGDAKRVDDELTDIIDAVENPTVAQMQATGQRLEDLLGSLEAGTPLYKRVVSVKRALESDFNNNLVGPAEVVALKKEADDFYRDGMAIFSGQAAQRIRRINRQFGRVNIRELTPDEALAAGLREGGTVGPNRFVTHLLDGAQDPAVVRNLYELMLRGDRMTGRAMFKETVGTYLDSVFRNSVKDIPGVDFRVTDVAALNKKLGLNMPGSDRRKATAEMLRLSGVSIDKFEETLNLAARFYGEQLPDVSTFITRRMLLGGPGSALRTFAPGYRPGPREEGFFNLAKDVVEKAASTAAVILALRGGAKKLTDPRVLDNYRSLLDPKASLPRRRKAIRNLLVLDATFLAADDLMNQYGVADRGDLIRGASMGARASVAQGRALMNEAIEGVDFDFSREENAR